MIHDSITLGVEILAGRNCRGFGAFVNEIPAKIKQFEMPKWVIAKFCIKQARTSRQVTVVPFYSFNSNIRFHLHYIPIIFVVVIVWVVRESYPML